MDTTLPDENNIQDAEVVISVDSTAAPVEERAVCTRESLLQPPDWRYQEAVSFLKHEKEGETDILPSDPIVQYVIRGLKGLSGVLPARNASRKVSSSRISSFMRVYWPTLTEVLELGTFMSHSAIVSQVNVGLIKGWDWEMAQEAGCPVKKEVYDLYASVFMDLTGVRAVHAWMQDFLFEPERYGQNRDMLRARLMAFHGSGTAGMDAAITGYLTTDERSMLKQLMKNERQKMLFDYVVKHTSLDPVTYSTLMETALKSMTEHDFQEHMKDRDDAGTGSLEELGIGLENVIRVYSQTEVANYNKAGVDFSNQYTQSLIEN